MAELISLTTPVVVTQTTTGYKVARLTLDPEHAVFVLEVRGTNGELIPIRRSGPAAMTLMSQLNTANGQIKSLQRRALEWAVTQPEGAGLVGTITGTPD
jgi:hypothetical protein